MKYLIVLFLFLLGCQNEPSKVVPALTTITCYDRGNNITFYRRHTAKTFQLMYDPNEKNPTKYCTIVRE